MKSIELTILVVCCVFLSSCGNYIEEKGSPKTLDKSAQEKLSANFAGVQVAVFSPRCTVCHQQYDSYQGVIREISAIQGAVASNRMPKSGGPLSDTQKSILESWIANGAPERDGDFNSPTNPDPLEANWKSISENIVIPKCLVCHNPQGQAKFLDLSSRQVIFDQRNRIFGANSKLINLDSPGESYLLEVLLNKEEPMPPIWSNIPMLGVEEVNVLNDWIKLGLP